MGQVSLTFLTESMFDDVEAEEIAASNVVVLDTMNQQMLERFNAEHDIDLVGAVGQRGQVYAVGEGLLPREQYVSQGALYDETLRAFWAASGFNNQVGLLKFVLARAGISGLTVPDPEPSLSFGYYYPTTRAARCLPPGTRSRPGASNWAWRVLVRRASRSDSTSRPITQVRLSSSMR